MSQHMGKRSAKHRASGKYKKQQDRTAANKARQKARHLAKNPNDEQAK